MECNEFIGAEEGGVGNAETSPIGCIPTYGKLAKLIEREHDTHKSHVIQDIEATTQFSLWGVECARHLQPNAHEICGIYALSRAHT